MCYVSTRWVMLVYYEMVHVSMFYTKWVMLVSSLVCHINWLSSLSYKLFMSMMNTGKIIWVGLYLNWTIHHLQGSLVAKYSKISKEKVSLPTQMQHSGWVGFHLVVVRLYLNGVLVVTQSNPNRTSSQKYKNNYLSNKSKSTKYWIGSHTSEI